MANFTFRFGRLINDLLLSFCSFLEDLIFGIYSIHQVRYFLVFIKIMFIGVKEYCIRRIMFSL